MKKIIVGNWKMNPRDSAEAVEIFKAISEGTAGLEKINIVVCPPFTFLEDLVSMSDKKIFIGAQNCFFGDVGPQTGEISAQMLKEMGIKYVIIGHSERRALGEGDELVNKKLRSSLSLGLKVILCVGERDRDESGEYLNFIKNQLTIDLDKIKKNLLKNLIVAYEPIWAIGKEAIRAANAQDILETSIFIRKILSEIFGREDGIRVPILYGGSVDANNCEEFLLAGKSDGLLVGRESLNPVNFVKILKIANGI